MANSEPTVAGETLSDLIAVLSNLELGEKTDGLTDVHMRLNDDETVIMRRALMRLEAELLLADADALDPASLESMRTYEQRLHDAFMLLVERVIEATGQQN